MLCKAYQLLLLLLVGLFPQWSYSQIRFLESAVPRGIDHLEPTAGVGGGVSFVDFDGDGDDDITLATGFGIPVSFYENNDGLFTRISPPVNNIDNIKQILWVDVDNDGDKDLYLNAYGAVNRLYLNTGQTLLEEITEESGLSMDTDQSYGAIWADFNRDGWLDLFTQERRLQTSGMPNFNRLYLNNADNTFEEITMTANVADEGRIPFCSGAFDYNNDKWPDIYIANDRRSRNTFLKNNGDETFTDVSLTTMAGIEMDGMSVTVGDYDRDGDPDFYVTNIEDGNVLFQNQGPIGTEGETIFTNVAEDVGVEFKGIGWGAQWLDSDLDGDLDLYVSGALEGTSPLSSAFYENNGSGLFSIDPNNGFESDTIVSRNNAVGDIDGDGLVDIVVFNDAPYKANLWHNRTNTSNQWAKILLQGVKSNRDAVGARIDIYVAGQYQQRNIFCGQGFIGQNSFTETVGLGTHNQIDSLFITWPTGHVDQFNNLIANQLHHLIEGASTGGDIEVDPDVTLVTVSNRRPVLEDADVTISPNPAYGILNISTDLQIDQVQIYNQLGQLIKSLSYPNGAIDIANLKAGVYFLNLKVDQGIVVKKFVKYPE